MKELRIKTIEDLKAQILMNEGLSNSVVDGDVCTCIDGFEDEKEYNDGTLGKYFGDDYTTEITEHRIIFIDRRNTNFAKIDYHVSLYDLFNIVEDFFKKEEIEVREMLTVCLDREVCIERDDVELHIDIKDSKGKVETIITKLTDLMDEDMSYPMLIENMLKYKLTNEVSQDFKYRSLMGFASLNIYGDILDIFNDDEDLIGLFTDGVFEDCITECSSTVELHEEIIEDEFTVKEILGYHYRLNGENIKIEYKLRGEEIVAEIV